MRPNNLQKERERQRLVIQEHYGLSREVTDTELDAEVNSLKNKYALGSLDDSGEALYAKIFR